MVAAFVPTRILFMSSSQPPPTDDTREASTPDFASLGLPETLERVLSELGYENPSPIQAATIPALLAGKDVLGQAQTGTGKTAAFALPILARIDPAGKKPSALVLAPTRELAIQVAEAFQRYAAHLTGFHVLPIYGGQAYGPQLAGLRRGSDVIVGTPGRVIDHIRKGSLDLTHLRTLVLDEADEMLQMGFIDDVELVLDTAPDDCQVALFSATMPDAIRRIANRHLEKPEHITIRSKTATAAGIRQRYWLVSGLHKLDALTRMLEVEPFDAMLVFARTRVSTEDLALRLGARGFSSAALNGDVPQKNREAIVDQLKKGEIDILVATDVAARGLDVERISHVVNYDIPYDTEAYVHRIGRTGRAGRTGEAILFVANRERHMLRAIERATRQTIEPMNLPTVSDVNARRLARFKERVVEALDAEGLDSWREIIQACHSETGAPMEDIAAALAKMARGDDDLFMSDRPERSARQPHPERRPDTSRKSRSKPKEKRESDSHLDADKKRFRIQVGHLHGVKPGNIVGAIANEASLDARHIGRVDIHHDYSLVDLPADLPTETFRHLKTVWVAGRQLEIHPDDGSSPPGTGSPKGRAPGKKVSSGRPKGPPGSRGKSSDKPPRKPSGKKTEPRKPPAGGEVTDGDKPPRKRPGLTRAQRKAGFSDRARQVRDRTGRKK